MAKAAGEAEIHIITDLVNQIICGVILVECELSIIVNCHKGKGDSLKRWYFRGMKLTN